MYNLPKKRKKMTNNLEKVYTLIGKRQEDLNAFYGLLDGKIDEKKQDILNKMLHISRLEDNKENRLALIARIVNLRDDSLVVALENDKRSQEEIEKIKHEIYEVVKNYHLSLQLKSIEEIEKQGLLSDFYLVLLKGVYDVGVMLSNMQPLWTKQIVQTTNKNLIKTYGENVYEFLGKNDLYEKLSDGTKADRAYSLLVETDGKYTSKTYMEAFEDMPKLTSRLEKLCQELSKYEDEEFGQKKAYINYFDALKTAFGETNKLALIDAWRKVDVAWMSVTSPIQVGHPLEYYEDHLRKAVAFEWDIRLDDVRRDGQTSVKNDILNMYESLTNKITKDRKVYDKCVANVKRVGLHVGRPAFYFGAEFDGLFSAQVVPNDEQVSKAYGKKIFAFADNIYQSAKARPFLKISKEVFGEEFLNKSREILFRNPSLWHKVYEVSTIGHEFGHILWLDEDSEVSMNENGMFKNIEEFKATTGGLVAFFYNEKEALMRPLMMDLIKRSIGLIAWMKTSEVEPYYCEGLIHLKLLFDTKVLNFKEKLSIDMSDEAYKRLKQGYLQAYESLAKHYLAKEDAKNFLDRYAQKEDGNFLPVDERVKYFVKYYWNLHQDMGRVIDEEEDRSRWL